MNPHYTPYNVDHAAFYGLPVATVDDAIRAALEEALLQDGWSGIPELNPLIWNRINSDVLRTLENHVQMEKAA